MTNLLAAIVVTVLTNVTESGPMQTIQDPCPDGLKFPGGMIPNVYVSCAAFHSHQERDPNAKERWLTTSIVERSRLTFDWNGLREVISERVLSSVTTTQRLEWAAK